MSRCKLSIHAYKPKHRGPERLFAGHRRQSDTNPRQACLTFS